MPNICFVLVTINSVGAIVTPKISGIVVDDVIMGIAGIIADLSYYIIISHLTSFCN